MYDLEERVKIIVQGILGILHLIFIIALVYVVWVYGGAAFIFVKEIINSLK